MLRQSISVLLGGEDGEDPVHECRHCGTTVDSEDDPCPHCGTDAEIVSYEL